MSPAELAWNVMRAKYGNGLLTWAMLPKVLREAFTAGVNTAVARELGNPYEDPDPERERRRAEIAQSIAEAEASGAYEAVEHASGDDPGLGEDP